jgi:hypothetical protein
VRFDSLIGHHPNERHGGVYAKRHAWFKKAHCDPSDIATDRELAFPISADCVSQGGVWRINPHQQKLQLRVSQGCEQKYTSINNRW